MGVPEDFGGWRDGCLFCSGMQVGLNVLWNSTVLVIIYLLNYKLLEVMDSCLLYSLLFLQFLDQCLAHCTDGKAGQI